jgi:hypothetical protein
MRSLKIRSNDTLQAAPGCAFLFVLASCPSCSILVSLCNGELAT